MSNTRHSCHILMKIEFSRQTFEKFTDVKFHENSSIRSSVVLCVQSDRWADMMMLVVAFRNFTKALIKPVYFPKVLYCNILGLQVTL